MTAELQTPLAHLRDALDGTPLRELPPRQQFEVRGPCDTGLWLGPDWHLVVDAPMVATGITGYPVICKAAEPLAARLARTTGITVPAAGVRLGFGEAGPGAIWVVGGASDALVEILRRMVEPALVIGVPAGFAGAAEAKDELRASRLPSLSNKSEKGGPVVAAAAFGALLRAARGDPEP